MSSNPNKENGHSRLRVIGLFTSFFLTSVFLLGTLQTAFAGCSDYIGRATINEVNAHNQSQQSGPYYVEIKALDNAVLISSPALWTDWTIDICSEQGRRAHSDCRIGIPVSQGVLQGNWLVLDQDIINWNYLDLNRGNKHGMEVVLRDGNGDIVDYLTVDNYQVSGHESCLFPYDTTYSGGNNFNIQRLPDGVGRWESTGGGNSGNETENDSNNPLESNSPSLSVEDAEALGGSDVLFELSLDSASTEDTLVSYYTMDGTAHSGEDYVAASGSILIPAGSEQVVVSVPSYAAAAVGSYFFLVIEDVGTGNAKIINNLARGTFIGSSLKCFYDDFNRSSLGSDWAVSNRSTGAGVAFGNPKIVSGRLQLTDSRDYVSTAASLLRLFPGAGNKIVYEFDHFAYAGNGADGMTVVLSDASVTPIPGGYGGSLGYAQRCKVNGFAGGWLGLGIDEFGNFSNDKECRGDGGSPTGRVRDSVAVRGSGSGTVGYLLHGESGKLSPPIDDSGSSTPSFGHRYRVTIDHSDNAHAYVRIERDAGSGYQTIIPTYDALAQNGQAAVPDNWLISMTGSTGASRNIHEIDNLQVCATYMGSYNSIDHYRIYHDGSGLTCAPEEIRVKACLDEDCSVEFAGEVTASMSPQGWVGGQTQSFLSDDSLQLWYTSTGNVSLDISGYGADFEAENPPRCFIGAEEQASCTMEFYDSGFIFDIPDHIAAIEQDVTISAVRKDETSQECVPGFQDVTKPVTLTPSFLNPDTGSRRISINGAELDFSGSAVDLDFDSSGSSVMTVVYPDVGEMNLLASYLGSGEDEGLVMSGNDHFITRPDHFTLEIPGNPAANSAAGGRFIRAGNDFDVVVSARNANDAVTPNYGQEEIPETVQLDHALVAPTGQHNPALSGSFAPFGTDCNGGPASGYACGQFSWNEVGIISLTPQVGDGSYLGTGNVIGNSSGNVGRFYPDHFAVSGNTPVLAHGCSGFTYLGQSFTFLVDPALTLTARGDDGSLLQNYGDVFWKYSSTLSARSLNNVATGGGAALTVEYAAKGAVTFSGTSDYDGEGVVALTEDWLRYVKPINPVAPFASTVDLVYEDGDLTDSDGVCYDAANDGVCDSFTIEAVGDTGQRYGRLQLQNAFGPETLPLTIPVLTEFFNGAAFVINSADDCTSINATDLLFANYQGNLADGETTASGTGFVASGLNQNIILSAPGSGNDGSVDLEYGLDAAGLAWLKDGGNNPMSKATFGIYQGSPRLIYQRESVW